ncbi:TIGR04141 family sporadically distributed protein, partial [Vibrio anguillarum]
GQYDGFWLGEPEVVDWESQIGYSFHMSPRAVRHVVLSLNDYLVYLEGAVPSVEAMKHHVVHVNNSEYKSVKSWPVY